MSMNVQPVTLAICLMVTLMAVSLARSARLSGYDDVEEIKKKCAKSHKLFYDDGTRSCEPCREICLHADIKDTEQQCKDHCSAYLEAMECEKKEDQYFDDSLNVCTQCSTICDDHEYKRTTEECKEKCSKYMTKLTPEQVASLHRPNSLVLVDGELDTGSTSFFDIHPGWIAAIAVSSLAIICTAVVLVGFMWARTRYSKQQYIRARQSDAHNCECARCPRQTNQPVEETSQDGNHQLVIDSGVDTQRQFALSDLGNRNETSRHDLAC